MIVTGRAPAGCRRIPSRTVTRNLEAERFRGPPSFGLVWMPLSPPGILYLVTGRLSSISTDFDFCLISASHFSTSADRSLFALRHRDMSAAQVGFRSASDMASSNGSDRGTLLNGLRSSPRNQLLQQQQQQPPQQQQNPFANMSLLQQQQMMALYQQQQLELAQQQAQLEMQLQLEQMRLQNLACAPLSIQLTRPLTCRVVDSLQEQIMLGQVAQAQVQAQAQADLQQRQGQQGTGNRFAQGGVLAERALARRQAQWEAAQQQQQKMQPEADEATEVDQVSPLRRLPQNSTPQHQQQPKFQAGGHHRRASSSNSFLSSPTSPIDPLSTTPALVLSKPGESFPTPATANVSPTLTGIGSGRVTRVSHHHTDSGSSASTQSSLSSLLQSERSGNDTPSSEVVSFDQKLAYVAANPNAAASSPIVEAQHRRGSNGSNGSPQFHDSPKLNPFSTVFIPGSTSTPAAAKLSNGSSVSPPGSSGGQGGFAYRGPRSGTPPSNGSPATRNGRGGTPVSASLGAMAIRQPRGPPTHESELEAQNFNSRIRRRAVAAIKALGVRLPASPTLSQDGQQQQPGGGSRKASLDPEASAFQLPMLSPGLSAIMAATRARGERLRQDGNGF